MLPDFKVPEAPVEDFAAECRHKFMVATHARTLVPFHVDKRKYDAEAWAAVDAYLDWLEINTL